MITQLRLDERLIHGQIVTQWSRFLDVSMIVVANDETAADPLRTKMLMMTAPAGKKVNIRSVDAAIKALKDPRGENIRMLVIVNNPFDALRITKELNVKDVNIANYTKKDKSNSVTLTSYVYCDQQDIQALKELVEVGENVFSQMIPSTEKINLADLLKKY